jgi:hypothetical protein
VATKVAVDIVPTADVLIAKLSADDPIGTETVAGKLIDLDVEDSFTETAPLPVPGAALRVTVPVALTPPATVAGEIVKAVTSKGLTVMDVVSIIPPDVAVIVTV